MHTQRFLITGGSQGIGAAIVSQSRKAGHHVVFTGRNEAQIRKVAGDTGAHGIRADVAVDADNARTLDGCQAHMGGVDVLINNAGFGYSAEIGALDVNAMRALFATNVFGPVDLTNRIVPLMKAQGRGDIVNLASTSGMKGAKGGTAYADSKWAVRGISQRWQAELRSDRRLSAGACGWRCAGRGDVPAGVSVRLSRSRRARQIERSPRSARCRLSQSIAHALDPASEVCPANGGLTAEGTSPCPH